ncbi:MAG: LPXTG cell wall anchor domain-containing protein [Clostridia bacterium]|nr:LPXTG cell wall anchor domain-containing protein [Clostridia bacterium]
MLISAFAADVPTFSLNVKSETDSEVVVTVNLDSGEFKAIDLALQANSAISGCKNAGISSAVKDFRNDSEERGNVMSSASNKDTMKFSMATVEAYKTVGSVVEFTLSKAAAAKITKDDVSLVVTSCVVDKDAVKANVVNNLPAAEAPADDETTTEAPADDETTTEAPADDETTTEAPADDETTTEAPADDETTTEAPADDETTTEAPADDETTTEAPADDETTTEAPADDETTTEAPADDETTTEAPADDETTTEAPADDETTTEETPAEDPTAAPADSTDGTDSADAEPAADVAEPASATAESDISNPATGDSLTATAAVISLLAVSGAAVVALRKKED